MDRNEWCTAVTGDSDKGNGKLCLDDRPCDQKVDPTSKAKMAATCEFSESCWELNEIS